MNLNRMIPKAGTAIVTVTVFLFAAFEIINFSMGSFFVCLILPIGFIMMTAVQITDREPTLHGLSAHP